MKNTRPLSAEDQLHIRQIVADLFDLNLDHVTMHTAQQDIKQWDSFQHLNLVLDIEREFDVRLSPDEITSINTVGDICELLQKIRATD